MGEKAWVVYSGTGTDPGTDTVTSYIVHWGDGNSDTYATGGIYPVLLTVDDGRGLSNSKSSDAMTVRINRSPQAVAGDNKRACIGDVVVFDSRNDRIRSIAAR